MQKRKNYLQKIIRGFRRVHEIKTRDRGEGSGGSGRLAVAAVLMMWQYFLPYFL